MRDTLPLVASESKSMVVGSLLHMHRRFRRDPILAQEYSNFIKVCEDLRHIERIPLTEQANSRVW